MNDTVLRAQDLSKAFRIGAFQNQNGRLGEKFTGMISSPFRKAFSLLRGQPTGVAGLNKTLWALRDVSFSVTRGEVVGIIGRNGAGKSTLLKILSQITEPTSGYAELRGRVGSLLEVGTGFHPELTGRENVYLNGAILGMKKAEIDRKFDEIASFAEIEEFLDTPVKHYSSGMYVRLAFAVAAHLEPEILLVDEVLAVGDIGFQKKCLGKMNDVAHEGRTVLFVSHNMGLMQSLTQRGILLEGGQITVDGPINSAITQYQKSFEKLDSLNVAERTDRKGQGRIRLVDIEICEAGGERGFVTTGKPVRFIFQLDGLLPATSCVFSIFSQMGQRIATFKSDAPSPDDSENTQSVPRFVCELDELLLKPGRYRIGVLVRGGGQWQDHLETAATFEVHDGLLAGRVVNTSDQSLVCMPHRWIVPFNS